MRNRDPQFKELLKPGRIGQLEISNRIVMAPMGTYLAGRDGLITERLKRYYEERAKGGAGLIIAGVGAVDHPRGRVMTRQVGISDDKFIPGLLELAKVVHSHGAKIGIQLQHGGRIAAPFLSGGHEAVSASAVPLVPKELGTARELTVPEINRLVQCFGRAAEIVQKADIDGVEIHAGHGYLINQFLSRSTNKRQDNYGGSLENRARLLMEIIQAVREKVGNNYPVWCRIDGQEFFIENGITRYEAREIARMAQNAGADAIHVSGYGGSEGINFTVAPLVYTPGYLVPLAREIKRLLKIPVITAGRISPEQGENILRNNDADFIAMGRPLIADPELPHKLADGYRNDIRKCIYCYTCVHQIFVRNSVCCAINASAGKESESEPGPIEKIKKILVVGGGPAGMEAARVAALRGHQVTLYEKEKRLGGSLIFASIVRKENKEAIDYLVNQIKILNVKVILGINFTPDIIEQLKPDAVILATGVTWRSPQIPGIETKKVIDGDNLRQMLSGHITESTACKLTFGQKAILYSFSRIFRPLLNPSTIRNLTKFWMPLGRRVTIIGGGLVGCELAAFISERGRKVTILESGEQLAPEMALPLRWIVMETLNTNQVTMLAGVTCDEVTPEGMLITTKEGLKKTIEADTIIIATGTEPDNGLLTILQNKVPEVFLVGDCSKIGFIKDAIADGFKVASEI